MVKESNNKSREKTDCKHWGSVAYRYLSVPGCELKYRYWCKFGCIYCKDYIKKGGLNERR